VSLSHHRREVILTLIVAVLWGCGSAMPPPPTQVTESAAPPSAQSMTTSPSPTTAVASPADGQADEEVIDGVGELDTLLDVNVVTVTDRLRVRSAPRVSDDSIKYEPLLPLGTFLYAFNGPVNESGYNWYEVALFSLELTSPGPCDAAPGPCGGIYTGWVARSGDGELWIEPAKPDCPPLPTDARAVRTVSHGERLGCFSQVSISFQARLISCNCDVDGGGYQPAWFGGDSQPLLLVEPSETVAPADYADWLIVALDPDGEYPDVLPVGKVVEVTGMFDHADARNCLYQGVPIETVGPPTPSSDCRFTFATTSIAVTQF
jgi:hypothetical protein